MAKVQVSFDTVEKTMAVSIDDKPLENVYRASLYRHYADEGEKEKFGCEFTTFAKDKANDMGVMTRIMASESVEAKESKNTIPSEIPGFVQECGLSKAQADIVKFFSKE